MKQADRIQDSLKNKSSVWIDYIEFRNWLNQFENDKEHENCLFQNENNVVLNENSAEGKLCINRESNNLELEIYLNSSYY